MKTAMQLEIDKLKQSQTQLLEQNQKATLEIKSLQSACYSCNIESASLRNDNARYSDLLLAYNCLDFLSIITFSSVNVPK